MFDRSYQDRQHTNMNTKNRGNDLTIYTQKSTYRIQSWILQTNALPVSQIKKIYGGNNPTIHGFP